jgi:hypothetical protein
MIKGLLIAAIALAPAAFAFDDAVYIVPFDKTGGAPISTAYVPTPSGGRDVIYDDQTYDYDYCTNGLSIYGEAGYESADDFIPENNVTVREVVIWLSRSDVDLRCDFYEGSGSGPGDDPPADFFSEEVPSADITWEDTGDSVFGYPVIKCTVPISNCELTGGDYYWLGFQNTTGSNTFWWAFDHSTMGGPYWHPTYFWYVSYWYYDSWFGSYDHFYELHGSLFDDVNPEVTDTYPHDSDFPSGVPVDTNVTFHVIDDVSGCDTGETTCTVEENGDAAQGELTFDDSDPLDVGFTWEGDDDYTEGASIDVEIVTYDLAGNGPVTEEWNFSTGYVNITPKSLGVIKAGFIK